jgi:uncharacterized cofD-like protein
MHVRWLRWWTPGMGIKRWVGFSAAGLLAVNGGVSVLTYALVREVQGVPRSPLWVVGVVLAIAGGAVSVWGARRLVGAIARALHPAPPRLLDAFYRNRVRKGPRIVAIGGGTGLATLLRGLKHFSDNITAVVAMTDNGGSSGRLRAELGVLPPGDLRHCLTALADEEELLTRLFGYRFQGEEGLGGHSFGNLFLTAMAELTGDLDQAIKASSRVLAVRGQVLPATLDPIDLLARFEDGELVRGESEIAAHRGRILEVSCDPASPRALPEAVRAIREADLILLGPGSLYTSLAPNLLIPEIRDAIRESAAHRLFVCNVMTQPGETDGFSASDHLRVLQQLGGSDLVHAMLLNESIPVDGLDRYAAVGQHPVDLDLQACENLGVKVHLAPLLAEDAYVRHDPARLARAVAESFTSARPREGRRLVAFERPGMPGPLFREAP